MPEAEPGELASEALVIDASVLINLLGCGAVEEVLRALPAVVLIERRTLAEVLRDPSRELPARAQRERLIEQRLLRVLQLEGDAVGRFLDLVAAPHELDDGEAATIACALELNAVAVLDERKARRIVREQFSTLTLSSTAGLFRTLLEQERMDNTRVRGLLLAAIQRARMSVPAEEIDWVIGLLGPETAGQCPSIRRSAIRRFGGRHG
jgi:predicted nucleic acid-binding protein